MLITTIKHTTINNIWIHFVDTFKRFSKLHILISLFRNNCIPFITNFFNAPFEEITTQHYATHTLFFNKTIKPNESITWTKDAYVCKKQSLINLTSYLRQLQKLIPNIFFIVFILRTTKSSQWQMDATKTLLLAPPWPNLLCFCRHHLLQLHNDKDWYLDIHVHWNKAFTPSTNQPLRNAQCREQHRITYIKRANFTLKPNHYLTYVYIPSIPNSIVHVCITMLLYVSHHHHLTLFMPIYQKIPNTITRKLRTKMTFLKITRSNLLLTLNIEREK